MRTALHRARASLYIWVEEDDQPEPSPGREEVSASDIEERAILSAIERLPELYRAVVALRIVKRMSYADIAQLLGRPEGTVKAQYHRGKQLLVKVPKDDAEMKHAEAKAAELQAKLAHKDQLPTRWRQAVELHYLQNLNIKEIAKRLGKPESTIKTWIRRGMEYLQNYTAPLRSGHTAEASRGGHSLPSEKYYELLDRVPSSYRREMKLYYEQLLCIADIAKRLNLSESAVKMHLKRGRDHLDDIYAREALEEAG